MPHRAKIDDPDFRHMDGWPKPAKGGDYPTAKGVVQGKVYTDEEEKALHKWQDYTKQLRRENYRRFLDGRD